MSGTSRIVNRSRNRLVGNYLENLRSNGLRGGVNIGYPYKIHCPNGTAEWATEVLEVGSVGSEHRSI